MCSPNIVSQLDFTEVRSVLRFIPWGEGLTFMRALGGRGGYKIFMNLGNETQGKKFQF